MDQADEQERREGHLKNAIESANQALKVPDAAADLTEQKLNPSFFYISSWPVDPNGAIQSWATTGTNLQDYMPRAFEAACEIAPASVQPDLTRQYPNIGRRGLAWRLGTHPPVTLGQRFVDLEVHYDGRGCLIMGGATIKQQGDELWAINAIAIATLAVRALVAFGVMYDQAGFNGPLDIGVAVTGIAQRTLASGSAYIPAFVSDNEPDSITMQDDYKQTRTIPAQELSLRPIEQARYLLWPLLQATVVQQDPFARLTVRSPQ